MWRRFERDMLRRPAAICCRDSGRFWSAQDYDSTSDFSEYFEFSEFSAENDKLMRVATGRLTRINSISGNIFPLMGMRIVGGIWSC